MTADVELIEPAADLKRNAARRGSGRSAKLRIVGTQLAILIAFFAVWEAAVRFGKLNPFFFGMPTEILQNLIEWILDGSIFLNALATLNEAVSGFLLAVVLAVPIGIFLARSPFWGKVFHPFIDLANSTPRFALAPLFVLIFGLGMMTKVVLVFSVVFFVMLINTIAGASAIEKNYIRFAQLVGVSKRQLFLKVIVPATAGWLIAGMRIGAPYAIAAAVVGEMISANQGLGYLVVKYAGLLEMSKVLAAVLVLAVGGWGLNACISSLVKRLPWVR